MRPPTCSVKKPTNAGRPVTPARPQARPQASGATRTAMPDGLACIRKCFAPPTYSYAVLRDRDKRLPAGVDRQRKERYLSDAEFERVLGASRREFAAFRPWKQQALKKAAGPY